MNQHRSIAVHALAVISLLLLATNGCGRLRYRFSTPVPQTFVKNPINLPRVPDDFVWLQVIDVIDDYFRIQNEQPVQNRANVLLEGRVDTAYRIGASLLEPWRKDSTSGFERLQSTLQSIRRRATVVVQPHPNGYSVEVIVIKELEDTDRSQDSTEAVASQQHAGTINRQARGLSNIPATLGWIPIGRDVTLEQVILQDILGRVTQADGPRH